jgi:hypothetical protein
MEYIQCFTLSKYTQRFAWERLRSTCMNSPITLRMNTSNHHPFKKIRVRGTAMSFVNSNCASASQILPNRTKAWREDA